MSGLVACCGICWSQGTWSDALFGLPNVGSSFDGRCGKCGRALAPVVVIDLCGEFLCTERATHTCRVLGGPTLHFCSAHAQRMQEAAREAGVSAKIEMHPLIGPEVAP